MKKQLGCLLLLTVTLLLSGCFLQSINKRISESIGIEIPANMDIEFEDTRGPMGDGDTFAIINFEQSTAEDILLQISENPDWKSLPLSESLDVLMYGGEKEGVFYSYELADDFNMPFIENGYWFFYNRSPGSDSSKDDSSLLGQPLKFTFAVYDVETDTLYYLEFDT